MWTRGSEELFFPPKLVNENTEDFVCFQMETELECRHLLSDNF